MSRYAGPIVAGEVGRPAGRAPPGASGWGHVDWYTEPCGRGKRGRMGSSSLRKMTTTATSVEGQIATFVMPHWSEGGEQSERHLREAVASVLAQTDPRWRLVIIDDGSPAASIHESMRALQAERPDQIELIFRPEREGPGAARNIGVERAVALDSPFVLFLDADDLAGERRLEVARRIFEQNPLASVVYTSFHVIDERSKPVAENSLTPSIQEILESHRSEPPQGPDAWIEIGTRTGYSNLTSATSVRTDLAHRLPFPCEFVSEDSHTWMRYGAGGDHFVFAAESPTLYRIPLGAQGSSSRSRDGGRSGFYRAKARVDHDGFSRAIELAVEKGKIMRSQAADLMFRFHLKLGETLEKEGELELAADQFRKALRISRDPRSSGRLDPDGRVLRSWG